MGVHVYIVEITKPGHKLLRVFDKEIDADNFYAEAKRKYGGSYVHQWEM